MSSDSALSSLLLVAAIAPALGAAASTAWLWAGGQRREIGLIACGSIGLSLLLSLLAVAGWWGRPLVDGVRVPVHSVLANPFPSLGEALRLESLVDGLTVAMAAIVAVVSLAVAIYARGYLAEECGETVAEHGDDLCERPGRFATFFCTLQGFVACMMGIVIAGSLFQAFVFWELVGLCSYLLIGFYRERAVAGSASTKAFVVNRVGDLGFLIGLGLLLTTVGTLSLDPESGLMVRTAVARINGELSTGLLTAATLGLFAGAAGKSAQVPLQVWLPDAMAGPTPVSALVHSATMVAAGVYLVARTYPLFPPEALAIVALVGCATLFIAALFALAADDVKRILAWSTVSQLGYMMLALGVGGWSAAVFHLMTHACFKSLLFLTAGAVLVACHHEQSVHRLGGLLRRMPWTATFMLIGVIAISGLAVPYLTVFGEPIALSGYHSKDAILTSSLASVRSGASHPLLFLVPLAAATLTAAYMTRLWCKVFLGEPRSEGAEHGREVSWSMRGPMLLLTLLAIGVAVGGESERGLLHALIVSSDPTAAAGTDLLDLRHDAHKTAAGLSLAAAFAGAIAAFIVYGRGRERTTWFSRRMPRMVAFLQSGAGFDEVYRDALVRPAFRAGRGLRLLDGSLLDGLIHRVAAGARRAAAADQWIDRYLVDGAVSQVASLVLGGGEAAGRIQTGRLRHYVLFLLAGLLCVFAAVFTLLA